MSFYTANSDEKGKCDEANYMYILWQTDQLLENITSTKSEKHAGFLSTERLLQV